MHTIRSRARQTAWNTSASARYPIFNPFQRLDTAPTLRRVDLEADAGRSSGPAELGSVQSSVRISPERRGHAEIELVLSGRASPESTAVAPPSTQGSDDGEELPTEDGFGHAPTMYMPGFTDVDSFGSHEELHLDTAPRNRFPPRSHSRIRNGDDTESELRLPALISHEAAASSSPAVLAWGLRSSAAPEANNGVAVVGDVGGHQAAKRSKGSMRIRAYRPWVFADPPKDEPLARLRLRNKLRSFWLQLKAIFGSWFSMLLPLVPIGFALHYARQSHIAVFAVNLVAVIPSTALISYGLEELSLRVGSTLGLLLDQTFSNAAQLISSILLLKARQIKVLQVSLLGAILANLLLMTGVSFVLGGWRRSEQVYSAHVAQALGMFLILAVLSFLIPTTSRVLANTSQGDIEIQSRGISIIIIISYLLWLFFQYSNTAFFAGVGTREKPKRVGHGGDAARGLAATGAGFAAQAGNSVNGNIFSADVKDNEEEQELRPKVSVIAAVSTLVAATVLLFFNAMFAADSVQGLLLESGLKETFVGIAILPLISVSPTAVFSAVKDEMDVCLSLTLDKCIQTALMVIPLTVIIAWGMGIDSMTLEFGGFPVATLFASVLIVTYVIQRGTSNWLVGALLIKVFIIIGLSSYFVT